MRTTDYHLMLPTLKVAPLALTAVFLGVSSTVGAEQATSQWPQWRGPQHDGVAVNANPPTNWHHHLEDPNARRNIAYVVDIPGNSLSTPIVWEDQIFVMTAIAADSVEYAQQQSAAQQILDDGEWPPDVAPVQVSFEVRALAAQDGRLLWKRIARTAVPHESHYLDSSWSAASPITNGRQLFAFFGSNGLYAYDLDGNLLWEKDLGNQTTRRGFGEGASPVLANNLLIVPWDHEGDSFVVALEARTGEEKWRMERPGEVTTWATPLVVDDGSGSQVILPGTGKSRGYDLATGRELWSLGGMSVNTIPSPVFANGLVFLASGYRTTMMQAIDPIAARKAGGDQEGADSVAWTYPKNTPYVPSVVASKGLVFFIKHFRNILTCLDARTGELRFETRVDGITNVWASLAIADDHLFIVGRDGKTAVLEVAPELRPVAINEIDDRIDASPVFVGDRLYLRGRERLYAIEADSEPIP